MLIRFLSTAFVLSLLCSCSGYKNAPLGRYAPPADWSGVWTMNFAAGTEKNDNQSHSFLLVAPVNATTAKLTWINWNTKPGQEIYERSEHEVSLCKIEGETIGCLKIGGSSYHFAVIKAHQDGIAAFSIRDSTWKEEWSSEQIGRAIAELVRKERGSSKWDAALVKKDGSNGILLQKANLKVLPEPPSGLIAKAEQRKRENAPSSGPTLSVPQLKVPRQSYFALTQADLQAKADAGDTKALMRLAICYDVGLGVADNPLKAKELVIQAKRKGNSIAHVLCNGYNWDAPFGPRPEKMVQLLEMGLADPDTEVQQAARYYLSKFYGDGIGCDRNPQRAFELATAGSLEGDAACSYLLARYLMDGVGCKESKEDSLKILQKLWAAGVTKAKVELIQIAFDQEINIGGLDPMDALNGLAQDSAASLTEKAMQLMMTDDEDKDENGTALLLLAASKGEIGAIRELRNAYALIDGEMDERVVSLDKQLRDLGNGYGFFAEANRIQKHDPENARHQYEIAGWLGCPQAWVILGVCMRDGVGGPADSISAQSWFKHAAINGYIGVHDALRKAMGDREYQELMKEVRRVPPQFSRIPDVRDGPLKPVTVESLVRTASHPTPRTGDKPRLRFTTPAEVAERLAQAENELSRGYPSVARMTAEMTLPSLSLNKPEHAEAIARAKAIMSAASVELGLGCKDDRVREALKFYTQAVILAYDGIPTDSHVTESLVAQNPNLVARLVGFSGVAWGRLSVVFHRLKRNEMAEKYWGRAKADMEQGRKLATSPALQAELHSRMAHAYINRFKLGLDIGPSTKLAVVHSAEAVRIADSDPTAVLAQAEAYYARALATVLVAHQTGVRDVADSSLEPIWRDIGHVAKLTSGELHNSPVSGAARRLLQTKPDQSVDMSGFAARIFGSLVNITDPFSMPQAEVDEMQRQGNAIMHDANAAAQARGQPAPYPGY